VPRKLCPVCGKGFVGNLANHWTKNVNSDGTGRVVTRCDWNLHAFRVTRAAEKLKAAGWVRAEATAARVISPMNDPEVAYFGPTGQTHLWVSYDSLLPEHWPRVWWTRPWVRALAEIEAWPMALRRQVIREAKEASQEVRDTIEAVYRIGGPKAAAELGQEAVLPRCGEAVPPNVHYAKTGRAMRAKDRDHCVLHRGHEGGHRGLRGTRWV